MVAFLPCRARIKARVRFFMSPAAARRLDLPQRAVVWGHDSTRLRTSDQLADWRVWQILPLVPRGGFPPSAIINW